MPAVKHNTKAEELLKLLPPRKTITELKDYQKECLTAIDSLPDGSKALVVMPTGTGKTVTFSNIKEPGRILIISAGKEIVFNALQYYPDYAEVGVEMMQFDAKRDFPNARIISASIQTIVNRLHHYDPEEFSLIIVDEAHHSTAPTYLKTIQYFRPKRLIGFTATPNRTDGQGLSLVYDRICYQRDIMWAINNGYLSDIYLRQVVSQEIDLRRCHIKEDGAIGETDFKQAELVKALAKSAPFIKQVYDQYAFGQTLIYVAGVPLAHHVADLIPNCMVISGDMDLHDRETILHEFMHGKIQCIVSVDALKEGVDLPNVQTLIYCRPTLSNLLYTQIVGRGLRTYPGKKYLNLIEIQGIVDEKITLCSAPNLMGIDTSSIPKEEREELSGRLLSDMAEIVDEITNRPEYLVISAKNAQRWADRSGYDLNNVNWFKKADGSLELVFPLSSWRKDVGGDKTNQKAQCVMTIPVPDPLDRVRFGNVRMSVQMALDCSREVLDGRFAQYKHMWDHQVIMSRWGNEPRTEKQAAFILARLPHLDTTSMTKNEANEVIRNLLEKSETDTKTYHIRPFSMQNNFLSVVSDEMCCYNGEMVRIVDYFPDPKTNVVDGTKKQLADDFTTWFAHRIEATYTACNQDVNALIDRMNVYEKTNFGITFLKSMKGRKYRYLQTLDGKKILRRELYEWFAKMADCRIPQIIDTKWVHPRKIKNWNTVKVDMSTDPLNRYQVTYPETSAVLSGKRLAKLPQYAREIKEQTQERWAEKEKQQEEAKKKRRSAKRKE